MTTRTRMNVYFDPELLSQVEALSLRRQVSKSAIVEAAVAAGADAIGFVFYAKSPRAVTPERARALARWLPPFVTPVGLFVNATADELKAGQVVLAFGSPLGQILLVALLSLYVATLVWMRRMATGTALPRFVGAAARAAAS